MPKTTSMAQLVEQDVHTTSAEARAKLGDKVMTADGRVYRYAKAAGTALDAGKLVVAADAVANHTNVVAGADAAVGATQITVTLGATAITADQYAEGYVVVNDAAGEGIMYKIASHPAAASAADVVIQLEDPIQVALTEDTSEVSLVYNLYDNVVISAVDQADAVVGVPNVAVGSNEYFWAQTGGMCAVLADEAVAKGLAVTIGTGVAGAVEAVDGVAEPVVGYAHEALVDTEYRAVRLVLDL